MIAIAVPRASLTSPCPNYRVSVRGWIDLQSPPSPPMQSDLRNASPAPEAGLFYLHDSWRQAEGRRQMGELLANMRPTSKK
jgi:hypothetical protein